MLLNVLREYCNSKCKSASPKQASRMHVSTQQLLRAFWEVTLRSPIAADSVFRSTDTINCRLVTDRYQTERNIPVPSSNSTLKSTSIEYGPLISSSGIAESNITYSHDAILKSFEKGANNVVDETQRYALRQVATAR